MWRPEERGMVSMRKHERDAVGGRENDRLGELLPLLLSDGSRFSRLTVIADNSQLSLSPGMNRDRIEVWNGVPASCADRT
jgi:hypothetical protein